MGFSTVQEAIDAISRLGMVVVVDDEDRENEGDLVMAAEAATSTRRSSPSRATDTNLPFHTSPIVPAPRPAKSGRASSPPKRTGARYTT